MFFLKCCSVEVPKFFAPVTNLLLPVEQRTTWKGMRTVAEIKREKNIKVSGDVYSILKPIRILKKLQLEIKVT